MRPSIFAQILVVSFLFAVFAEQAQAGVLSFVKRHPVITGAVVTGVVIAHKNKQKKQAAQQSAAKR